MKIKVLKCEKCGIRFKDRGEPDPDDYHALMRTLCMPCAMIWKTLGLTLIGIGMSRFASNRNIVIRLEDVEITKRP